MGEFLLRDERIEDNEICAAHPKTARIRIGK
jgi:hypothetical protein